MSSRTKIRNALVASLKTINGPGYNKPLRNNVFPKLLFLDQITNFPTVCVTIGPELREYEPAGVQWGFLTITIRIYVDSQDPEEQLEAIIEDIENKLTEVRDLTYDTGRKTDLISVTNIVTDGGLLAPKGWGEITLEVQYTR